MTEQEERKSEDKSMKGYIEELCPGVTESIGSLGELAPIVGRLMKSWTRLNTRVLETLNLTPTQMDILFITFVLSKGVEEVTQIQLSHKSYIDPMTISTILRNLEKRGFVTREHSTIDTRARVVKITKEGKVCLSKALSELIGAYKEIFAKIDKQPFLQDVNLLYNEVKKYLIRHK